MVSPRKRILQTNIETRSQTPASVKSSRTRVPQVFKPYRFYLDIKGKSPASLIEDIRGLGGVSVNVKISVVLILMSSGDYCVWFDTVEEAMVSPTWWPTLALAGHS